MQVGEAAALTVAVVLAAVAPARSQVCSTTCSDYYEGHCIQHTTSCTTGPSTSAPSASYGAIAYGRTSVAWGYSYRWGSRAKAESTALQNCKANGDDCEVIVWFEHKCGAVAASDDPDAFWGLGNSEAQAGADAKAKCDAAGGKNCTVQVSHCSR
jgi:hypothetical protein